MFRILSLLSYLWHGKSRYHVHSDFVYRFVNQVLRDKRQHSIWDSIEKARHELMQDKRAVSPSRLGTKRTTDDTTVGRKAKLTALPPIYGRFLYRTASYFNAANILELGTGTGISTLYVGTSPTVRHMITLEGHPTLAAVAEEQIKKLHLGIEVSVGDFNSTLLTALGKLGTVDLAFIDGDHQKQSTLKYYEAILPYTHNNTVLVFDDIHWSPEMQEAWQEVIARPEVTLSIDIYRMGLVFFRKEFRQPQHMQLYYW